MNYEEFLEEVKKIFTDKLNQIVTENEYQSMQNLLPFVVRDKIYTNIMALGYNFGDRQKAIDDVYEMQVPLFGESNKLYEEITLRINDTIQKYPNEVLLFSNLHKKFLKHQKLETILSELEIEIN